jgi:rod shape-determining protein MreC
MRRILELLDRHTAAFSLGVAVVLSAALMSLGKAEQREVRAALQVALWPSQRAVSLVAGYTALWSENRRLRRDLASAKLDRDTLEGLKGENRRLRALFGFSARSDLDLIPAQVVRRGAGLLPGVILIDRGTASGIRELMTVICPEGLVGTVAVARSANSEVELLTAKDFAVSARVAGRDVYGIVKWDPGAGRLRMQNVPVQVDIVPGDLVLTSSLGGKFVDGVRIGRVKRVEEDEDGLFNKIELEAPTYLWSLREVFVVSEARPSPLDTLVVDPGAARPGSVR